jgi:sigma-E factor negative regulatory protein RseB
MRRPHPARGPAAWWLCLAVLLLGAQAASAAGEVVTGAQARQWLARINGAAAQSNYQGTLVVTTGTSMQSSRVAHFCEGSQSYERVDMLDGQPRRVLRHNEQVLTLWPMAKVARLELREPVAPFPALLTGSEEQLFERYEMVAEGTGRVAGLEASVFLLRPRDAWRFAQRVWAEQSSGLLLRADVIAADGHVLETSAFSDLALGVKSRPQSVQWAMKQLDGWRVLRPTPRATALDAEGWQIKVPVAGFRQASCVKRQLDPAADDERQMPAEVLQTIFTDGLTSVSLFIEPYRPERHRAGGGAMQGATHTWMQALGASWITVVGDVPMATLRQFASALEHKP